METVMIPTASSIQPGIIPYRVKLYHRGKLFMIHDTTFKEKSLYGASRYTLSHVATGYAMARHDNIDMLLYLCEGLHRIAPDNFDELVGSYSPEYYELAKRLRTKIRKSLKIKGLQS